LRQSCRLAALALVASLLAAAIVACGDDDDADDEVTPTPAPTPANGDVTGTVDVLGIWSDVERESFEAMVAPWADATGANMAFTGTREITEQLRIRLDSPPDVAIPAEIGLFREFARDGHLAPLSECPGLEEMIRTEYPQSFIEVGTVNGTLYGFFMKADTKGAIFYNPELFDENDWSPLDANASWDDLVALSEEISGTIPPWSIGIESGETTGWAGTDWIQQILLNEYGPDVYDGIIDGSVPMTHADIQDAWEKFGEIALNDDFVLQPVPQDIIATNFEHATYPPFQSPPQAAMTYLGAFAAGFIQDQFPGAEPGTDFDFFTWPGGGITGGANVVYAFNMNPAICSFLTHIASGEAQRIWVEAGGFTSLNTNVDLDSYPDPVSRAAAEQLLEATVFRFDLDDAIGGSFQQAFFDGLVAYLQNPGQLERILANIEAAREQ
jgi:alpha-glucoside transport system substrate-binding protein